MNLQELRQKLGDLCDQQQAIVDKAVSEGRGMSAEEKAQFDALQVQINGLDETIKAAEAVQARAADLDKPAGKQYRPIPGDYSQNNRKLDDGGFENLGEFVCAIRFGDPKGRLAHLASGKTNGIEVPEAFKGLLMPWIRNEWTMGTGAGGGFAVPEQRLEQVLMLGPEAAIVRPRGTVIPAGDPPDSKITIPAFKQGAAGVYGGVEVFWIGEGVEKPETDGNLREVSLTPQEVTAHTVVTDKLLRNWQAASTFIGNLLRGAMVAAEEYAFLRGNGVAKPLGAMNGAGALVVNRDTANDIKYVDIVGMLAKLTPESVGSALWVANQSTLPKIATLQDGAGNYIFIQGDATRGIPATLAGIPIRFTGKTPALGSKGDLILLDLRYYLIKDGSGPFIAASEHVLFKQNKTVIKVFWNVDGKGWVDEPLTLEDGVTKVSPYVVLDVPAV